MENGSARTVAATDLAQHLPAEALLKSLHYDGWVGPLRLTEQQVASWVVLKGRGF
jgi:hypothetical protein